MHWESYKMIRSSQLILYDFMYDKVSDKDWYNDEIAGILWGIQSSLPFQRSPFSRIPGAVAGAPGTTALKEAASSHRISRRNPEFLMIFDQRDFDLKYHEIGTYDILWYLIQYLPYSTSTILIQYLYTRKKWGNLHLVGWWVAMWPNTGWPAVRAPRRLESWVIFIAIHWTCTEMICLCVYTVNIYIYIHTHMYDR